MPVKTLENILFQNFPHEVYPGKPFGLNLSITEITAGITTIAPISEKPTVITVTSPKFWIIGDVESKSAENPKTVVRPETVIAVPIFWIAVCIAE